MKKLLVALMFTGIYSTQALAGNFSDIGIIGKVTYHSTDKKIYINRKDATTWDAAGCTRVYVDGASNTFQGSDGFMSLAMTAKLSKVSVRFFGYCDAASNNFIAHSIEIQ